MKRVGWLGVSLVAALLSVLSVLSVALLVRRRPRLFVRWSRQPEVMPEERISMVEEELIR